MLTRWYDTAVPRLLALDVALLLPPGARDLALTLSAALPAREDDDFRLDADHLPHVTLTQQFVRVEELEAAFGRVDEALRGQPPLTLRVAGGGTGGSSVWMAIERSPAIVTLHERLMEALRGFERPAGGPGAFFEEDARVGDVLWVAGYHLKSSFGAFTPHVTLGYASEPPRIAPFTFEASLVAACHLGRHCSCRRVLRSWELA
jgi:2'-5' RNA ligase